LWYFCANQSKNYGINDRHDVSKITSYVNFSERVSVSNKIWQLISLTGIAIAVAGCSSQPAVTQSSNPAPKPVALAAPKNLWVSQFQQLNGTPYLYAPIYVSEQEQKSVVWQIKNAASSSYEGRKGYEGVDIRNYMFVHRDDLSSSKLLPTNTARILQLEEIGDKFPPDKSNPERANRLKTVKYLWYVTALNDTNDDKILNDSDRQRIAISDVSGANYTEIIKDIDKILLVSSKGLDRRLVIYSSGSKRFVADIDLAKRQATVKELPALD
jgi:hypothetical protein